METQAQITEQTVTEIATLATQVATEHAEYETALAAQRAAEAALLDRVIALVRPSLRAVSSRIRTMHAVSGGANGCNPWEREDFHGVPGLRVAGDGPRDKRGPDQNSGDVGGWAYYLLVDGTLAKASYSGSWSRWQGSTDETEAEIEAIDSARVAQKERTVEVIESILKALREQLAGAKTDRTRALRERAAKLEALAALL